MPAASISADGNGSERRLPATVWSDTVATVTVELQDAPPLVERHAMIAVTPAFAAGTMTVPFGCTTGWPPRPLALLPVLSAGPQVRPPSVEVDIFSRSPLALSSNSV